MPVFAVTAALAGVLPAQESRGTITGRVTDPSDAVVPGVKVTARNTATNVAAEALTNSTGSFMLPYLTPGVYDLTAELAGFATLERKGVEVLVGDKLAVDFQLKPAGVTSSIEVTAESTPMLSTESASTGTVMDRRQIAELPLPFGNPFMLASLSPGVVFTAANMLQIRPYDNGVVANMRVDGAPGGNEFALDGAPNNADSRGLQKGMNVSYIPPADAVQEFKMETSSFDARLGHSPGAAVNVVLKSGTNGLHGSAWEFTRFHTLVANDFYLRRAHVSPPVLSLHRYGTTLGGPVILPKIYDGRNRTFFFFAFEKMDTYQPLGSNQTVPTAAQRTGDFSAQLSQNILIYDPFSARRATGGRIQRTPFPGNKIAGGLDPIAQNLLKYYPAPNAPGDAQGSNNYVANDTQTDLFHSEMIRVDHNFSARHRTFARLLNNFRDSPSTGWAGGATYNGVNPSLGLGFRGNVGLFLDHVYVPSPTDVIDVRAGITRYTVGNYLKAAGFDLASLGFPTSTLARFNGARYFPTFSTTGVATLSGGGGDFAGHNIFFVQPAYTRMKGRHVLNAGYDVRAYRLNAMPAMTDAGTYSFGNAYTKGPLDNSPAAPGPAQGLASMLLGLPTGGSINRSASSAIQSFYQGFFLQDDFKVSRRLTLNLGLRYEIEIPTTERYNRTTRGFDMATPSPIEAAARAAYAAKPDAALAPADFRVRGGLLFADSGRRGIWETKTNLLQPRFGAVFQITPRTVLRGGWGLYMLPFGLDGLNQPGFSQTTNIVPTLDGGLTFAASLADPFPNGVLNPAGPSAGLSTFLGQGVSFTPLQRKTGTTQRWKAGLQRELPGRWVVEVSYTETRGGDMGIAFDLNAIPRQYLSTSPVRDAAVINFLTAQIPNPMAGLLGATSLSGSTVQRAQILLPFPQFSSVISQRYDGSTRYRGMEIRANHRFRSGFTLTASYSRSRLRERLSLLNPTDASPEDRVSGEDRPNHFSVHGIMELPFGRGRRFGTGWNRVLDVFLGGWQMGGVYLIQSGRPLSPGNLYFTGDPNKLVTTYDKRNPGAPVFDTSGFYFHDAAVQTNGADNPVRQRTDSRIQLANNIRTLPSVFPDFRGDHINQIDASLVKNVHIVEPLRVQLRAELINVLNQVQFNTPSLNPASADFGKITASSQLSRPRTAQFGINITF
ncbi:MAG: TonB-dependent receptor domain-containing protein [Bryobacteraceae bacterium]